jgi:hypothetical protein
MAKLQRTFLQGKMNKDLDERLIPNGQYRDAQNIQVSTSEGSDVGAVENMLGNTLQNLRSTGPDVFWPRTPGPFGLTNPVCIGVIKDPQNEKIYWFLSAADSSTDAIVEYDQVTKIIAPIIVDVNGVLNFNKLNLITGVNILGGMLFWTDDLSEPKKINIARFKAGSTDFVTQTQVYSNDFILEDVTVILKSPSVATSILVEPSLVGGVGTGITPVFTTAANFNTGTGAFYPLAIGTVVALQWGDTLSFANFNGKLVRLVASVTNSDNTLDEYEVTGTLSGITVVGTSGNFTIVSIDSDVPNLALSWSLLLIEDEPIFQNDFPRFSYRWKYADGEYSTYAPFSEAAFIGNEFDYSSTNAFNKGMVNFTRRITLGNFQTPTPDGVVAVEVLYKGVSSNNVYNLETFKVADGVLTSFVITTELLGSVIESSQLLRPWDNVPRKAKSQEVIGNRIIYGNYLQNYTVGATPQISADQTNTAHANNRLGEESVKSNRTYQIGVTFIDEFNRESPVFTNKTAAVNISQDKSANKNILKASVTSAAPGYADFYKYYIKDPAPEYYNLVLDRFYDAEDGNIWLSFPSVEINKVREDGYLFLKKRHGNSTPVTEQNKYKILDISSSAPGFISSLPTVVANTNMTPVANGFILGNALIKFNAAEAAEISEFHKAINSADSIQFTKGSESTQRYNIISGGATGAIETSTTPDLAKFEVTLDQGIDDTDSWITSQTAQFLLEPISVTLYNNIDNNLPEFQGRFFAKIPRNSAFLTNVELPSQNTGSFRIAYQTIQGVQGNPGYLGLRDNMPANLTLSSFSDLVAFGDFNAGVPGSTRTPNPPTDGNGSFTIISVQNPPPATNTRFTFDNVKIGASIRFKEGANLGEIYTVASVVSTTYLRGAGQINPFSFEQKVVTLDRNYNDQFASVPTRLQVLNVDGVGSFVTRNPAIFETEPADLADLDIYYEASDALAIGGLASNVNLDWFNCYSFGNGVESDRIRDDFNAPTIGKGVRVSSTLDVPYEEERRAAGMIFSGIFNSTSGVNNTNQFLIAENITKDLNPTYGSIQKLHARDTDLIALLEDKCFRILANKDALFNADGSTNVTSSNNVLGQTVPFVGEYGISKNPESFASFGFRSYFTDKARGAVMRLSRDGLTDIGDKGMSFFFQDAFKTNVEPAIIGTYDSDIGSYNVVLGSEGLSFKERVDGWNTRMSYDPEFGISLNNEYYTFKDGSLWEHSNPLRSNFYGVQYESTVKPIFNDAPTSIKNFKTLSYEGTAGWTAAIATNEQSGEVNTWKKREGIYFNYIIGDGTFFLADLDGDVTNSNTIVIAAPNTDISVGDTITGVGISGIVTVTNIAADKITITMSSAQTLADEAELTFTKVADIDTSEFSVMGIGNVLSHVAPYNVIVVNGEINISLQSGDIVLTNDPSNVLKVVGTVLLVNRTTNTITLTAASPVVLSTAPAAFILFAKNTEANTSGLLGYQATVKMTTTSSAKKELFAVNSEIFISSE